MKLSVLPQVILARLLEFDQYASSLAEQAEQAEQQVEHARDILNGKIEDPKVDVRKVRDGFEACLKQAQAKRHRCHTEQRILSNVKVWLERLPPRPADCVRVFGVQEFVDRLAVGPVAHQPVELDLEADELGADRVVVLVERVGVGEARGVVLVLGAGAARASPSRSWPACAAGCATRGRIASRGC